MELLRIILRLRRYYARYITACVERIKYSTRRLVFARRIDLVADTHANGNALVIQKALSKGGCKAEIISGERYKGRIGHIPMVLWPCEVTNLRGSYFVLQTQDLSAGPLDNQSMDFLRDAAAILDFSITNIEQLLSKGLSYKKLFYLPLEGDMWFFLARFLLAIDFISYKDFYNKDAMPILLIENPRICLSLPETVERRRAFSDQSGKYTFFDGLRHRYAWVGCGMSYKYLCQNAMSHGLEHLIVVEDDVLFDEGFEKELEIVLSYLSSVTDPWHVFSGFIANLHADVKVSKVEAYAGMKFIHINKLSSTVFNIYNKSVFERISKWDEQNYHFYTNTIDRFLGNWKDLKVITTLPFLVGHKEDVDSSIWNFNNARYVPLVVETIERLSNLVHAFRTGE